MPKDEKFWIGVDLDGTLAEHYWPEKGRYEETRIGDSIVPMVERVKCWLREGKSVKIFTARVSDRHGRDIMPIRAYSCRYPKLVSNAYWNGPRSYLREKLPNDPALGRPSGSCGC